MFIDCGITTKKVVIKLMFLLLGTLHYRFYVGTLLLLG